MECKFLLFLSILILNFSCSEKANKIQSEHQLKNDWQSNFGLTHDINKDTIWNKPVKFYIQNKDCDQSAKDFYFGKYKPTDEPKTAQLLNLAVTENNELRPFYRWILNKTIQIQDGALAEYTGIPARKYAEKFPMEFFEYMEFDKSGVKYDDWRGAIEYSGYYKSDDYKKPEQIRENMISQMNQNCEKCEKETKDKIELLAKRCFPDIEKP